MFFLYSATLVVLSFAFLSTLLDGLRFRSLWRFSLTVFIGTLIIQTTITSFESSQVRELLDSWKMGPLEENLSMIFFGMYVMPLILFQNWLCKKKATQFEFNSFRRFFCYYANPSLYETRVLEVFRVRFFNYCGFFWIFWLFRHIHLGSHRWIKGYMEGLSSSW